MAGLMPETTTKPLIGIGSCLAGNAVRYNGDTKKPNQHVKEICEHFDARAFCPEMGIGLGVPRPPIQLVGTADTIRVLDVETLSHDYTDQIRSYARHVLAVEPRMCGYILVKGSPSCGYSRVKRFSDTGSLLAADQRGIFAAELARTSPLLPLEDDDRLNDVGLCESFVNRAFAYHEWQLLVKTGLGAHELIKFYSRYKYLVLAHHMPGYNKLGPMLANAGKRPVDELAEEFITTLMDALAQRATRRSHSNALFHIAGYLKRSMSAVQRQRLHALIDEYRTGQVALSGPVTMLRQHFADKPDADINSQVYPGPCLDGLPGGISPQKLFPA